MVWISSVGRNLALSHGTAASEPLHGVAVRCELSGSQLIFERFERMLRTILTVSTHGVVIAIGNRTKNVAKQP